MLGPSLFFIPRQAGADDIFLACNIGYWGEGDTNEITKIRDVSQSSQIPWQVAADEISALGANKSQASFSTKKSKNSRHAFQIRRFADSK